MKTAKKITALILSVIFTVALLAGCGGKKNGNAAEPTKKGTTGTTEKAGSNTDNKQEETYTYTIIQWLPAPLDDNAPMVKKWEDEFGVKFKFDYIETTKITELLPLRIASGDIPDIITSLDYNGFYDYVKQGIAGTWDEEFFRKNASYISKLMDEMGEDSWKISKYNEKMFTVPGINCEYMYGAAMIWRNDWLKNLGITEIPYKLDQVEAALYKFRNGDPDGNKQKDTYGLSQDGMKMILGAFGAPEKNWIDDGNGGVIYSSIAPQTKDALVLLRKWYKDEVLDPEFITGENKGGYWALSHAFCNGRIGFTARAVNAHWKDPKLWELGEAPYLKEVKATRLPMPEGKTMQISEDKTDLNDPTIYLTALGTDIKGYIAYLTGDTQMLEDYFTVWQKLLEMEVNHLVLYKKAVVWRILEMTGMLPEELRQPLLNFFYKWANSEEGIGSIDHSLYQSPYYPRQNHGLIPALGLVYLSDYFTKFHADLKEPYIWKEKADKVYAPYFSGSWKPVCDGLCHGWWLSQPAMLEYGLMDDKHRYFEGGGARKAAECAMTVVNSEGWMPCSGDSDILRQFPGFSLRIAAAYYNDGRYRFVNEMAPFAQRGYCGPITYPPRAFDTGVQKEEPCDKIGIDVIPIDPLVYYAWEKEPKLASGASDAPPKAPIDKCFDKLAIRTGWGRDDDYLLIDGLGGGSHSYADAMSILDYQRFGVSFIVAEDSLHWPEPENHSMVTIYKDGKKEKIPSFAELMETVTDGKGNMYAKMKLKDYNGADWIREIYMIPEKCVVFHDTIIANDFGNYTIENHFRTPGIAEFENTAGNIIRSKRKTRNGETVEFKLLSKCSRNSTYSMEKIPIDLKYRVLPGSELPFSEETNDAAAGRKRYHLRDICLSVFTARTAVKLNKGEQVKFTHVACADKNSVNIEILENSIKMLENNSKILENEHSYKESRKPVNINLKIGDEIYTLPFSLESINAGNVDNVGDVGDVGNVGSTTNISISEIKRGYEIKTVCEESSAITAAQLVQDKYLLCGLKDGTVTMYDVEGNTIWSSEVDGKIHDVSLLEDKGTKTVFAAHGKAGITAVNEKGEVLWSKKITRIPTLYPWWEFDDPTPVKIKTGILNGEGLALIGCGDNYVRFYDKDGNMKDAYYYFASVPAYIHIFDVDSDGEQEVIVGGGIISADSGIDILDSKGKALTRFGSEGWVSKTTAFEFAQMNGYNVIACGVNHRTNLHLYRVESSNPDQNKISYRRIVYNELAGAVTGIALIPYYERIFAGTSQGFVSAYDFHGKELWMEMMEGAVTDIAAWKNSIIVTEKTGKVNIMTLDGKLEASTKLDTAAANILKGSKNLYFISGNCILKI
ncbi:MAG TPA: hypothetical protein PK733_00975 [Clostridiales bacterium]|nr:hypothetical protein [Clostridiales bacterium]